MNMLRLGRFSIGVGDRFARQARAQLRACLLALEAGVEITPVWNKSNREHNIVGSEPAGVREAAATAVRELGWTRPYFVDADHINLDTAGRFLDSCDFFTIDVAHAIGQPPPAGAAEAFARRHPALGDTDEVVCAAAKYLAAVQEAARVYRRIEEAKGAGNFITEVSMDETDSPQTPFELLVILAALADERVPLQTIAPRFSGRFNKGVDYQGDTPRFEREFEHDLDAVTMAVQNYGLPSDLKLSIHSGSDKFSIYGPISRALDRAGAGVHVKTAGTTWLEEIIGLAEADGAGLALAKEVYAEAYGHVEELCAPYAAVIDIDPACLPRPIDVWHWSAERYVAAVRHDPSCPDFNPHMRQLLHVGYKVAARMGDRYLRLLDACQEPISRNVTYNLFERHIKPLFLAE